MPRHDFLKLVNKGALRDRGSESEAMRRILTAIIALVLGCSAVWAQNHAPLSDSELAAITVRGRFLADYDTASWHATDAVLALKPAEGKVGRYIAKKTTAGWNVVFGKLNETGDAFLVAYDATQESDPRQFAVRT